LHAREKLVTGPDGIAERLEPGARLRKHGAVPGRPEAALWAHQWRIDAAFQLGEMAAVDAELAGLARLAGRLGWPLGRWHLLRVRAARALLTGQYQEAENLALAPARSPRGPRTPPCTACFTPSFPRCCAGLAVSAGTSRN
jgi:hypothetical protein